MNMLVEILVKAFLVIWAVQVLFFILAYILRTDKFTDFAYGTSFIIGALFALLKTHSPTNIPPVKLILLIMVSLWGLRLSIYLLTRILKIKKDKRFDEIRGNFAKFAGFWLLQAVTIWSVSLPVLVLMATKNLNNWSPATLTGQAIWAAGFIIEAISDQQKFSFLNKEKNKYKWVNIGLWKYSRHPNYFGEILCWIGIFIYSISLLGLNYWYIIASPIYITSLLLFVSGIPPAEKSLDKKFGNNPKYQKYKEEVSPLILLPRKKREKGN